MFSYLTLPRLVEWQRCLQLRRHLEWIKRVAHAQSAYTANQPPYEPPLLPPFAALQLSASPPTRVHVFIPDLVTLHIMPGAWNLVPSWHAAMQMSVPQVSKGWSGGLLELRPGTTGTHLFTAKPVEPSHAVFRARLCADPHHRAAVAVTQVVCRAGAWHHRHPLLHSKAR
jgi:hypothetical protein